jgi:hypothetical protein
MFPLLLALLRQVPFVGDLLKRCVGRSAEVCGRVLRRCACCVGSRPEPAFGGREYGGRNQGPYDRDERW